MLMKVSWGEAGVDSIPAITFLIYHELSDNFWSSRLRGRVGTVYDLDC